jgi:uncharacterized BrkB/YihY/UPF0761 family membrane protein
VMVTEHIASSGALALGGVFALVGILGLFPLIFVILVVANRAEPDPRGMRPFSVYLFGMSFVTLMLTYGGLTIIVTSLLSFIAPHPVPIANSVGRSVVIGALLVIIAGVTMSFHLRKGLEIAHGDERVDGPNARILHTYIAVITFIFVVTIMISLGVAVYLLFQLAGPGVFGSTGGGHAGTLAVLLDLVYVMLASGGIVLYHARLAPLALRKMATVTPPG